jgi:hypothetical protein
VLAAPLSMVPAGSYPDWLQGQVHTGLSKSSGDGAGLPH